MANSIDASGGLRSRRAPFHEMIARDPQEIPKGPVESARTELGLAMNHLYTCESYLQGVSSARRKAALDAQIQAGENQTAKLVAEIGCLKKELLIMRPLSNSVLLPDADDGLRRMHSLDSKVKLQQGNSDIQNVSRSDMIDDVANVNSKIDDGALKELDGVLGESIVSCFEGRPSCELKQHREFLNRQIIRMRKILDERSSTLEEQSLCCICFERDRCVLLRPCSHLALCESCSGRVDSCPICRAHITTKIKVKIS